ncbi:hypothetical protein Bca101_032827 [Brassica carinata]
MNSLETKAQRTGNLNPQRGSLSPQRSSLQTQNNYGADDLPPNITIAVIWTNRSCPRPTDDSIRFKTRRLSVFSTQIYRCRL